MRIDGPTVAPRGRSMPAIVCGFIKVRTTIGITGCSRIDSFSTASSQASPSASPASAAAWVRRISSGVAAELVERPGQRGRGGLVAGEQQRDELVAELDVVRAWVAGLLALADQPGQDVGALGEVGRRTPLADLGVHQLVELHLVLHGAPSTGRLRAAPVASTTEQHRRADVDGGVDPRAQRGEPLLVGDPEDDPQDHLEGEHVHPVVATGTAARRASARPRRGRWSVTRSW